MTSISLIVGVMEARPAPKPSRVSHRVTTDEEPGAAQQGAVADAAARPQDRGDFEKWILPGCHLDLSVRRS
jgi:hypothetical protein